MYLDALIFMAWNLYIATRNSNTFHEESSDRDTIGSILMT